MLVELDEQDLIWKEGAKHWLPVVEWEDFQSLFPPEDMPPLPEAEEAELLEESQNEGDEESLEEEFDFSNAQPLFPSSGERKDDDEASEPIIFVKEQDREPLFEEVYEGPAYDDIEDEREGDHEDDNEDEIPEYLEGYEGELPHEEGDYIAKTPKQLLKTILPAGEITEETSEVVPLLPPLPPEASEYDFEDQEEVEFEEGPPELPPLPVEPLYESEFEEDQKDYQEEDTGSFDIATEEGPSQMKFYLSAGLGLLGLIFFIVYLTNLSDSPAQVFGVSKGDKEAILSVIDRPFTGTPLYRLRPSKDLTSLWFGSNYPHDGNLSLKLNSKRGKVLGEGHVEMVAESEYRNGVSHFDEIEITKGGKILPGEYKYTAHFTPGGTKLKWFELLKNLPFFKSLKTFKGVEKDFTVQGSLSLIPYGQDRFKAELKEYRERIAKNVVAPLKERLQRYKTFLSLLEQIRILYINTMRRITKGKSIALFEERYNNEIGPMYRDLIIDTNKRHLSLINIDEDLSSEYFSLLKFGKEIGGLASDMVTETRTKRKLGRKVTDNLILIFDKKADELAKKGQFEVESIESQLSQYE